MGEAFQKFSLPSSIVHIDVPCLKSSLEVLLDGKVLAGADVYTTMHDSKAAPPKGLLRHVNLACVGHVCPGGQLGAQTRREVELVPPQGPAKVGPRSPALAVIFYHCAAGGPEIPKDRTVLVGVGKVVLERQGAVVFAYARYAGKDNFACFRVRPEHEPQRRMWSDV